VTTPPLSPWRVGMATISAITPETPGTATYDLAFDDPTVEYRFLPGQFNMLYLPGVGEVAISVSSDPAEPTKLRHTIRAVGNVTQAIARLKPGDKLGVRGPFGNAWPVDLIQGQDIVVVAGGLGLAPLRPAIYHLLRHRASYGRVTVLHGARTPRDLLFTGEYDAWRIADIDVQVIVNVGSADWKGAIGVVTTPLANMPLTAAKTSVLTCGPEVMMRFVAAGVINRGVRTERIFVSLERNMNCAVGLCGHCQFGPSFVCKDGPVFPYDRVQRLMLVENM